jgi:chemotaxis response regulator CheB
MLSKQVITLEKRCFLAGWKDSLFKDLVVNLLNGSNNHLTLIESHAVDFEGLLYEISKAKPDVILLEESSPFSGDSFLVLLLVRNPNLPVIVISELSNEMHIMRRETLFLNSSSDLIRTINQIPIQTETLNLV